jgi:hypothetical protein
VSADLLFFTFSMADGIASPAGRSLVTVFSFFPPTITTQHRPSSFLGAQSTIPNHAYLFSSMYLLLPNLFLLAQSVCVSPCKVRPSALGRGA